MPERLTLAVVVVFRDEREHLPTLLGSLERQRRAPDRLLLVDDGSADDSSELARGFARSRPYVAVLRRQSASPRRDRLARAGELTAFQWACARLESGYDVIAKLDADLELSPGHLDEVCAALEDDPELGIAGAWFSVRAPDGSLVRERHPSEHVRGANKFYRRACLEQIAPLPAQLGWDTVDELKARMLGWRTRTVALSTGDTVHLRPTGDHDGRLRARWRWGQCAYGYGSHPLAVLLGGARRMTDWPPVLGGLAYVAGWLAAASTRRPRAAVEVRAFRRREELRRLLGGRTIVQ